MSSMMTTAGRYLGRLLVSLWCWPRGRTVGVGPGDTALGHSREQVPMTLAMLFGIALEGVVVGLLVPWPVLHVLHGIAVVLMLGLIAIPMTRPHVLGGGLLRLRHGALLEVPVPLASIASVRRERRTHQGSTVQVSEKDGLALVVGLQTDVLVELAEPVIVRDVPVRAIRFRADDPAAAVAAIRAALQESVSR